MPSLTGVYVTVADLIDLASAPIANVELDALQEAIRHARFADARTWGRS